MDKVKIRLAMIYHWLLMRYWQLRIRVFEPRNGARAGEIFDGAVYDSWLWIGLPAILKCACESSSTVRERTRAPIIQKQKSPYWRN
jgi:hypothetical protein